MITYTYIVKCPECDDEFFDFFDEAKDFAMGCLTKKPIITQTEVNRNDFGECTDHCNLGTVWSWEDMMKDTEPEDMVFSKGETFGISEGLDDFDDFDIGPQIDEFDNSLDFEIEEVSEDSAGEDLEEWINTSSQGPYVIKVKNNADGYNYEGNGGRSLVRIDSDKLSIFNSYDAAMKAKMGYKNPKSVEITLLADEQKLSECRKPIPEGMTIEQLVEEMEENEDTVECTWCEELFDKSECRNEVNLGWLCSRCEAAIKSRGETLTFKENNYWDFLDEDIEKPIDEDLEWHTYKITFTDKFNPETEHTTTFKTWQSDVEYAWRMSNANIPHTVVKNIELIEDIRRDPFDHHDPDYDEDEAADCIADQIDNAKDAEYDKSLDTLEEATDYRKHLALCPECGADQALDTETGICINCGFSL